MNDKSPQIIFDQLIKNIGEHLKAQSYSKKGNTFYIQKSSNWGLINFQKSSKSTATQIEFTINLGICSQFLLEFHCYKAESRIPTITNCHFRERIGSLLPNKTDKWWVLTSETAVDPLSAELSTLIVEYAIAEINRHLTDDQLISLWLSNRSPGLTEFERLSNLCILLKTYGREQEFQEASKEFLQHIEGAPTQPSGKNLLMRLNGI